LFRDLISHSKDFSLDLVAPGSKEMYKVLKSFEIKT
jgi:hypothetical protein